MQLIDTHCHLDFSEFDADRDIVIKRARENDVGLIINVGSSLEASKKGLSLANLYDFLYASVGIHPHEADKVNISDFSKIEELAKTPKVVAIGETGLDYFRNLSNPVKQQEVFKKFIDIAAKLSLPLIIHCRKAEADILSILEANAAKTKILMHCFSGDEDFLKRCLDKGFFISFTCNITYKKALNLRQVVRITPLDRILLETDAPFLPPENFRGKRNEPMHIKSLAQEISRIKGMDLEDIAQATTDNAKKFFNLP